MAKKQNKYTPEFKQQIVDLYATGNYSIPHLESEYGVSRSTISGWIKNLSPIKVSEDETISMKDYKALQKKMKELEIENEILHRRRAEPKKLPPYSQKIYRGIRYIHPKTSTFIYCKTNVQCLKIPAKYLL